MSQAVEANISFVNFQVMESHIVFKEAGNYKLELNFTPKGYVFKDLNQFHLGLDVIIRDQDGKFEILLKTTSIFDYVENADIVEYSNSYFILNAPAIVFPYLRAYITSLTALSGMPTLVLPTLNLANIGVELKNNIEIIEASDDPTT